LATPTQAIQLALQIDYSKANYLSSLLTELWFQSTPEKKSLV
jgi:hypothetical protein